VLLEQINVLRHQVFVAQNSHKSSLFLCDLVIHFIDVRFLFRYAVGLGLRGCHSNVRLGRSRSARLITKSVYTSLLRSRYLGRHATLLPYLVGEKRCVTTQITAAEETMSTPE